MKSRLDCFIFPRAALLLAILGAAGVCDAQPAPEDDGPDALLARGNAAAINGHLDEAIAIWLQASKFRPNDLALICNIGGAEFRRGAKRSALPWLTRCIHDTPPPTTLAAQKHFKQQVVELLEARESVAGLMIRITEPDARSLADNEAASLSPLDKDIFVEPSEHTIHAHRGSRGTAMSISTKADKAARVALVLPPEVLPLEVLPPWVTTPPAPAFRWWPVALSVSFAVGGAFLGGFFTFASIQSHDQAEDWRTMAHIAAKTCGADGGVLDPQCQLAERIDSRSRDFKIAAMGSFIVAGALTGGTIAYVIYENNRVSVSPTIGGVVGRYVW